jgi:hypothetical protein
VAFTVDGNPAGSATVSGGVATVTNSSMTAGSHTIGATYAGDTNFTGSSGTTSHTVNKVNTTTALLSSPNPSVYGQTVNLSATVSPSTATGTITFNDGANAIGTGTLPAASMATGALSVGSHSLTASYPGDSNHNASTSNTVTHVVNKANTSTSLSGPGAPVDFGSNAPLTVSVGAVAPGAGTPTGTVTLTEGSATVGSTTLSGGSGALSLDLLPGTHTLVATYGGDGNFNGSSSNSSTVTVTCQTNRSAPTSGSMTIGSGSTCVTGNVSGTIYIASGARAFINGISVGSIIGSNAARVTICGTTVAARMTLSGTDGPVLFGDATNGRCAANSVHNYFEISNGDGPVLIADNVLANLAANNNDAGIVIANNHMAGLFSCYGNNPAPVNNGRPNQAQNKVGQCSGL